MPQVNISIAQKLDEKTMNDFQLEIGNNMNLLPGKTLDNTIIRIIDGCSIFKGGKPLDGAFVEVRLFKASPEENKKAFAEKIFSIFKAKLNIEPGAIYMNYLELDHWASNGNYN